MSYFIVHEVCNILCNPENIGNLPGAILDDPGNIGNLPGAILCDPGNISDGAGWPGGWPRANAAGAPVAALSDHAGGQRRGEREGVETPSAICIEILLLQGHF